MSFRRCSFCYEVDKHLAQVSFLADVAGSIEPPLVVGPPGSTDARDMLRRINDDVLNGRKTPAVAAAEFVKLVKVAINQQ